MKSYLKFLLFLSLCIMVVEGHAFSLQIMPDSIKYDQRGDTSFKYSEKDIVIKDFKPSKKWITINRRGFDAKRYYSEKEEAEYAIAMVDNQLALWENILSQTESLKKRLGKAISTDSDIKIINMIVNDEDLDFDMIEPLAEQSNKSDWKISYTWKFGSAKIKEVLYNKSILNKLKTELTSKREKDRQVIAEDLKKGIISKKLKPHLDELQKRAAKIVKAGPEIAENKVKDLKSESQIFDYAGQMRKTDDRLYDVTLTDTILNPLYKDFLPDFYRSKDFAKLQKVDQKTIINYLWKRHHQPLDKGWEWYDKIQKKKKEQSYPVSVTYYYTDSLPQYRFKSYECYHGYKRTTMGMAAFNDRGELIRIIDSGLWHYDSPSFVYSNPRFVGFYQIAYKENEYDIHSAGKDVNHYIKVQLDLEKMTAVEEAASDRAAERMANAFVGSMTDKMKYGNSKKGKVAQRKRAADFISGMSQGALKGVNEGLSWFEQIGKDYWDRYLQHGPYSVERLSDTSFRLIYTDLDLKPAFEVIIEYTTIAPYKVQDKFTVKKL